MLHTRRQARPHTTVLHSTAKNEVRERKSEKKKLQTFRRQAQRKENNATRDAVDARERKSRLELYSKECDSRLTLIRLHLRASTAAAHAHIQPMSLPCAMCELLFTDSPIRSVRSNSFLPRASSERLVSAAKSVRGHWHVIAQPFHISKTDLALSLSLFFRCYLAALTGESFDRLLAVVQCARKFWKFFITLLFLQLTIAERADTDRKAMHFAIVI